MPWKEKIPLVKPKPVGMNLTHAETTVVFSSRENALELLRDRDRNPTAT